LIICYIYIRNEVEGEEGEEAQEFGEEYKMLFSEDTKLGNCSLGVKLDDK